MKNLPDPRTIQCFVTVAREANVTRAAKILHLTQPAVSLQLKRLSEATGLTLFDRTANGLVLTPDGALLARKAEQALTVLEEFRQTARDIAGQVRGRLRIGTILDPDSTRLGAFLNVLVRRSPGIETALIHGMSGNVPQRLLRDELDAGYYVGDVNALVWGTGPAPDEAEPLFHRLELARFSYRVIAPPGWEHRVVGKQWDQLAALPWIATPPESAHRRMLEPIFRERGLRPNIIAVVDQEPSMLAMVISGVGLSLCRESIALSARESRGVVISDTVELSTSLEFICLRGRHLDPAIQVALAALGSVWGL